MISGFFLYSKNPRDVYEKLKKRIPKTGILLAVAFVIYGGENFIKACVVQGQPISDWIGQNFLGMNVIAKILFGTFFCGPMWFLYAQIWAYIFLLIWIKKFNIQKLYGVSLVLLVTHVLLRTIVRILDVTWYSASYFRTFLLYALPYIIIGYAIADIQQRNEKHFSTKQLMVVCFGGGALQFVEYAVFRQSLDFYIVTIFYSVALFLLCVYNPDIGKNGKMCFIGKNLSMPVYMIHMVAIEIAQIVLGDGGIAGWMKSIMAIAISMIMAFAFYLVACLKNIKHKTTCKGIK